MENANQMYEICTKLTIQTLIFKNIAFIVKCEQVSHILLLLLYFKQVHAGFVGICSVVLSLIEHIFAHLKGLCVVLPSCILLIFYDFPCRGRTRQKMS